MTDLRKAAEMALDALKYNQSNWYGKREAIAALEAELSKPEHRFDTPESHIVKWSIPVDPNNFGEPVAQPEQDWDLLAATQESLREHMAKVKELESKLKEKNT